MIWFTQHTSIEERIVVPSDFPMWTYDPVPITNIPGPSNTPKYFIDILGIISRISDIEQIQTATHATPSLKRTIFIREVSDHEIRLDMWGECATRFEADTVQAIGEKEHVIAIFVGTLAKMFKGQTTLNRSAPCRRYINKDIPKINALCAR